MSTNCAYCRNIFSAPAQPPREPWNKIIVETPNFVVTPTLGAMVEGWVLIISKHHVPAMGALADEQLSELSNLTSEVRHLIELEYGPTVMFEHGPAIEGTKFGCGIDHAHFHVVPLSVNLSRLIEKELEFSIIWESVSDMQRLAELHLQGDNYIYIAENCQKHGDVALIKDIPSQFIRRVIANHLKIPTLFDYKQYQFYENAANTIMRIGKSNKLQHVEVT